jgi:hypothetical protein
MNGMQNLMITLTRDTEIDTFDSDLILTEELRGHERHKQKLSHSMLSNLKLELNKIKAELVSLMFQ